MLWERILSDTMFAHQWRFVCPVIADSRLRTHAVDPDNTRRYQRRTFERFICGAHRVHCRRMPVSFRG